MSDVSISGHHDMEKTSTSRADGSVNNSSSSKDDEAQQTLEVETKDSLLLNRVIEAMVKTVTPLTPRKKTHHHRRTSVPTTPVNHSGPIPDIPVGSSWKFRSQVATAGVHRPLIAGIHGRANEGALSIVLSGEYEEDEDHGDYFFYSGCGGKEADKKKRMGPQVYDQKLTRHNLSLARCCNVDVIDAEKGGKASEDKWREGKPVRVVRKYSKTSLYAPKKGFRYDGIYKVVEFFPTKNKNNLRVWKYKLRRDDESPAPWTPEGRQIIEDLNLQMILPPNEDELPAKKVDVKTEENSTPTRLRKVAKKGRIHKKEKPLRKSPRLTSQKISYYSDDELPLDSSSSTDFSPSVSMEGASMEEADLKPNLQNLWFASDTFISPTVTSFQQQHVDHDVKPSPAQLARIREDMVTFEEESYAHVSESVEIEDVKPDIEELNRMMSIDHHEVQVKEEPMELPIISSSMSLATPMETDMSSDPTPSENLSTGTTSSNLSQISKRSEHNWQIPQELLVRLRDDRLNLENWNCVTNLSYRSKEEFYEKVKIIFSCHLCTSFGIHPVTLKCKHIVCQPCLEKTKPSVCQMCTKNAPANFREFFFDVKLRDILIDLFCKLDK